MKRILITTTLLIFFFTAFSSDYKRIGVSIHKTTILSFDSPIRIVDVGNKNPVYEYINSILKLTAISTNFKETSLFVQTDDGLYEFVLYYEENPKDVLHIITVEDALKVVGKTADKKPSISEGLQKNKNTEVEEPKADDFKTLSHQVAVKSDYTIGEPHYHSSVLFQSGGLYIHGDYMYLKVNITNKSDIPIDIDYTKFQIETKKGGMRKKDVEIVPLLPYDFIYNGAIKRIEANQTLTQVYIFNKFTISSDQRFISELWEKNGARIVQFFLSNKEIIKAKSF